MTDPLFRVSFVFQPPVWRVARSYDLRGMGIHAEPVRIDRDHGRKRLLILCPDRVPAGTYSTPYEVLRAYLLALPTAEKVRREAEMKEAA